MSPPAAAGRGQERRRRSRRFDGAAFSTGLTTKGSLTNRFGFSGETPIWAGMVLASVRLGYNGYCETPSTAHQEKSSMSQLIVRAGDFTFQARFEEALAPKTVAAFRKAMPFQSQAIHNRWSGEAVWMPLGDLDFGVSYQEPHQPSRTRPDHPLSRRHQRDRNLGWPMAACITPARWASPWQSLHHPDPGLENLTAFGKTVLWKGAQNIPFEEV